MPSCPRSGRRASKSSRSAISIDYAITADGDRITVVLNGVTILSTSIKDLDTDGGTPDGKKHPGLHNRTGYLGFLGHTMPVKIRNVRIREL